MIEVAEDLAKNSSVSKACQVLGVPRSSLYWARQPKGNPAPRPTHLSGTSAHRLSKTWQKATRRRLGVVKGTDSRNSCPTS